VIKQIHSIAFTHRNLDVRHIGRLHIEVEKQQARFEHLKSQLALDEVVFLSTCNRVEYFFVSNLSVDASFLHTFFTELYPEMDGELTAYYSSKAEIYNRMDAVSHLFRVASSIDSLVIGEREIITQVRQAYEQSRSMNLSGDTLRILFNETILTAKRVYSETKISERPVSVVSIAYQRLQSLDVPNDARVLVVGTGVTNTAMARFLKKHGMTKFTLFNRTLANALPLAEELNGEAFPLSELPFYNGGFDVLVTCTGSEDAIIDTTLYDQLLQGDMDAKITIDLALPNDIADEVHLNFPTKQISINTLQKISDANLVMRSNEIDQVEAIINESCKSFINAAKLRSIEIAMRPVPQMVKDIKATAFNEVFKNDIEQLDTESLAVLEKIVGYMEKKYMSMPMIMAKEILFKS
jgi:glutamyl-tRNA reductase